MVFSLSPILLFDLGAKTGVTVSSLAGEAWTIQQFDFDADIVRAEETDHGTINALDPNLRPFIARGGKLIHYHGWSDPQISPGSSTQYYSRVKEALGNVSTLHASYRLFTVPGIAHCGGGEGPNALIW